MLPDPASTLHEALRSPHAGQDRPEPGTWNVGLILALLATAAFWVGLALAVWFVA